MSNQVMLLCMGRLSQAHEVCDPGGGGRAAVCMVTAQQVVEFVDGGFSGATKAQQLVEGRLQVVGRCLSSIFTPKIRRSMAIGSELLNQ